MRLSTTVILTVGILALAAIFSGPPVGREAEAARLSRFDNQTYDGVVSSISGETHNYNIAGTVTAPYCRFYNRVTKKLWNSTTSEMESKATAAWVDTDVPMTDETLTVGGWLYVVPATIPAGWYDVLLLEQAGGSPAAADVRPAGGSKIAYIQNGIMVSMDVR